MNQAVSQMIDAFTLGRMTRRELIAAMSGLVAAAATGASLPARARPLLLQHRGLQRKRRGRETPRPRHRAKNRRR